MTTDTGRASAIIYQFPARGRFAAAPRYDDAPAASPWTGKAVNFGAWYHEEAIADAERPRKK